MKRLKPIISVQEIPYAARKQRQRLPSLRTLVRNAPQLEEEKLIHYLRQGVICGLCFDRGQVFDVLTPGKRIERIAPVPQHTDELLDGSIILTDGDWVWAACLIYYVQTYHLQLPAEFSEHAQENDWTIDSAQVDVKTLDWRAFDEPC